MYGVTKGGKVKGTDFQWKKHFSMFSERDKRELSKMASELSDGYLKMSKHLREKIDKKEVSLDIGNIRETLKCSDCVENIIEYNETFTYKKNRIVQRILLKLKSPVKLYLLNKKGFFDCNIFVVIEVTTKEIVTAYPNIVTDTHRTLDITRYCKDMVVRGIQKNGIAVSNVQEPDKIVLMRKARREYLEWFNKKANNEIYKRKK